ncbi:hypothetical protein BVK86_11080 [Pseudomonas reinekei]|uniref:Integrase n=1 Tax=Pseudomonas reinekei TaxID=395598 RepID=A0A1Q9WYG1_PSERE|nr:hypothetical protein BVK86_11080 [Pseudomonas reinekei]
MAAISERKAIRVRLQLARGTRDLALFNFAIDSKLRSCDLARRRVTHGQGTFQARMPKIY